MTYRDRVKQTTTTIGTGAITLGSASAGYRAIADAYGVGELVPYCIESQTPGEWEVGVGTLTAPTTLARTTVTASSNAGALVNFSAGTKNVMGTAPARGLSAGLTNPDDVGFDIVLCFGQSNMEGNPVWDPLIDISDSRISQFAGSANDATYRKIVTGSDPMYMYNGPRTGLVGPITWFGKAYLNTVPSNRRLLVVPVAVGSSAMVGNIWAVGGQMYNLAIAQSNLAITAAQALYPNSRFVGCIMAQGEADAINAQPQATYAAVCKDVIAGLRANITGASNSWFVISGMVPEKISGFPAYGVIAAAHQQVAAETNRAWYVAGPTGYAADVHYTAPGIRIQGARLGLAVKSAKYYSFVDVTAPTALSAVVQNATPTAVVITASESLNASFVPATTAFTVGGHAVSAVGINGSTFTLTVDAFVNAEAARTVAYVQPGTNQLRDVAGNLMANFSGLAITNNVAAADITAPVLTLPTGTQTGTTTANAGATTDEANGTMYVLVNASATATAAAVKASTFTQAITTTGAKSVAITGLAAATLYYAHIVHRDAAGNDSLVSTSASFTTASSATAPAQMAAPTATGGNATASVVMVAPADGGSAITGYTVTSSPAGGVDSNAGTTGLTHTMTGLTNGTAYTFTATATNAIGTSAASPASNSVTPAVPASSFTAWSPTDKDAGITLSNTNTTAAATSGFKSVRGVAGKSTGKWYYEISITTGTAAIVGVGRTVAALNTFPGANDKSWGYYSNGVVYYGNVNQATNAAWALGDVIGVVVDLDISPPTIQWYKNNVVQGVPLVMKETTSTAWIAGTVVHPMAGPTATTVTANFGSTAFTYAPPTGFTGWTA